MRVLLADDHQILRDGIRRGLESAGEDVVGEAGNGEEGVALARETAPDIVLMDLSMPVLDGVGATRRITDEFPDIKVVVLTMHDDPERTRAALEAGAVGYLTKGTSFADVLETLRRWRRARRCCRPRLAASMLEVVGKSEPTAEILSDRQVEILQMIADGMSHQAGGQGAGHHPEDGAQPPERHLPPPRHAEPDPRRAVGRPARHHRPPLRTRPRE